MRLTSPRPLIKSPSSRSQTHYCSQAPKKGSPLSAVNIPSSPRRYHTQNSRNDMAPLQNLGVVHTSPSPPANSGQRPPFSRESIHEHINPPFAGQMGQNDRRLPYQQGKDSVRLGPPDAGHTPLAWDAESNSYHRGYAGVESGNRRPAGRNGDYVSQQPDRRKRRRQKRLQHRLERQTEPSRQDNSKPIQFQTLGAINVSDTQRGTMQGVLAMFCPEQEYSAVHPHLLAALNIRPHSLAQEPTREICLPQGPARASRSTNLVIEQLLYGINAGVEHLLVLDKKTPWNGIDIYLGQRFLKKHCDGKLPVDPFENSESWEHYPEATVPAVADVGGVFQDGVPENTAQIWGEGLHTGPSLLGSGTPWGRSTFTFFGAVHTQPTTYCSIRDLESTVTEPTTALDGGRLLFKALGSCS